ncbi:MAG: hypothetical protein CL676_07210 [Bdellovibrionaceae bacterium]|nr:hypothetical protein [Pseudobdellovibrionaceae bacterium]
MKALIGAPNDWSSWKEALRAEIDQKFSLVRKNENSDLQWQGPSGESSTMLSISARLTSAQLKYELNFQGRDPVDVIFLGVLPGLMAEQARRYLLQSTQFSQINTSLLWFEMLVNKPEELLKTYSVKELQQGTKASVGLLISALESLDHLEILKDLKKSPLQRVSKNHRTWPESDKIADEKEIVGLLSDVFQQAYEVKLNEGKSKVERALIDLIIGKGFFQSGTQLALNDLVSHQIDSDDMKKDLQYLKESLEAFNPKDEDSADDIRSQTKFLSRDLDIVKRHIDKLTSFRQDLN